MASQEQKKDPERKIVWGGPPTRYYTPEPPAGTITSIKSLQELPYKVLEGIIEGINKDPADFVVLGMGFYVGYMGLDVNAYLMRQLKEIVTLAIVKGAILPIKAIDIFQDLANMPIEVASGITGALQDVIETTGIGPIFPGKHITPATKGMITTPGVSYYGPAPVGVTDWPPHGYTLAQLEQKKNEALPEDQWKWQLEIDWAEIQLKLMMGCLGALTAYALTRPGFMTELIKGTGEILKGVGEIVPL